MPLKDFKNFLTFVLIRCIISQNCQSISQRTYFISIKKNKFYISFLPTIFKTLKDEEKLLIAKMISKTRSTNKLTRSK